MKGPAGRVDQVADELYQLPLEDFTKARDERARALRKEGLGDEAAAVKALRKPNLAAWALNSLTKRQPGEVKRLLEVGSRLREAQEALLAGSGRGDLDRAAGEERQLVAKLARDATAIAGEASTHRTGELEERIRGTLHAAALDEETAAALAAGRLVRDTEAVGLFGAGSPGAGSARKAKPAPGRQGRQQGRQQDGQQERQRQEERVKADRELKTARTAEQSAKREQAKAARVTERAARHARDAEARADEARAGLREAQRREKEAATAHDRAVRALAKAETKAQAKGTP